MNGEYSFTLWCFTMTMTRAGPKYHLFKMEQNIKCFYWGILLGKGGILK